MLLGLLPSTAIEVHRLPTSDCANARHSMYEALCDMWCSATGFVHLVSRLYHTLLAISKPDSKTVLEVSLPTFKLGFRSLASLGHVTQFPMWSMEMLKKVAKKQDVTGTTFCPF
ncbi:hypothetical protein STEG23_024942 [Scotinomys teguina]